MKKVHLIHIFDATRKSGGKKVKWWILADGERHMVGKVNETKAGLIARWIALHGKPDVLIRVAGYCRMSEAAMTVAELEMNAKGKK